MRNILLSAAAASAALLAIPGCNSEPEVINRVEKDTSLPPPPADVGEAPPPSTEKVYRCAQPSNAVYYVSFNSNNTVFIRSGDRNAPSVLLNGPSATGPFTGEGYTLSGNGNHVTINGQSCRA